jgi:hypothetical protein
MSYFNKKTLNVIGIFGTPRSGTSWLGQIFNSSPNVAYRFQPLFSNALKGRLSNNSSEEDIKAFYVDLLLTKDDFILQKKNVSNREGIIFLKKEIMHLVWKEVRYHYVIENLLERSTTKIIGIIRHPCSVIWSWLNAPKEFKHEWDIVNEWRFARKKNLNRQEEYNGYEKWKELAFAYKDYAERFATQFTIIKYEDLNLNTEIIIKKLFEFAGIEWQNQTEEFITTSKTTESDDPYGVFRMNKINNDWMGKLPLKIENEILNDPDFILLNKHYQWGSQ